MKTEIHERIFSNEKDVIKVALYKHSLHNKNRPNHKKSRNELTQDDIRGLFKQSRRPIGILYAFISGQNVFVGWSMCNKKDNFNIERGIANAKFRAIRLERCFNAEVLFISPTEFVPAKLQAKYDIFVNRSQRYFKDGNVIYLKNGSLLRYDSFANELI